MRIHNGLIIGRVVIIANSKGDMPADRWCRHDVLRSEEIGHATARTGGVASMALKMCDIRSQRKHGIYSQGSMLAVASKIHPRP